MRSKTSLMFADLRPNELHGIEFGCAGWKTIDMQATMPCNELLSFWTDMILVIVPDPDNLTWNKTQHMNQKSNRMKGAQIALIRTNGQSHTSQSRTDQKRTKQIQTRVMVQTGACGRRLSTWRPAAFERRHQREAAFIYKYQRSPQCAPLFLSLAKLDDTNRPSLHHRVGTPLVAPSGNSNSYDPVNARRHWTYNEC